MPGAAGGFGTQVCPVSLTLPRGAHLSLTTAKHEGTGEAAQPRASHARRQMVFGM